MNVIDKFLRAIGYKPGQDRVMLEGIWTAVAYRYGMHRDPNGIIWREHFKNTIVDVGLDDILGVYFRSATQTATGNWFMGMTNADPVFAPGDTMANHPGWTDFTAVSETNRPPWGQDPVSGQSITNSTPVTYSCNANGQTAGGLFIVNENTIAGTTGTLFNGGAFTGGNRALNDGETIDLTCTINASSQT